jgi:aliphatic nitrilase
MAPDQEGLLVAEIDLGAIGVAKNAADPAGHYSRPDVTRLLLNKKPYKRVEEFAPSGDTIEPTEIAAAAS